VRLDDIPPGKLRTAALQAYAADLARAEHAAAAASARAHHPTGRRARADRYRCARCARYFAAWAPAERHADEHGGATIELVL